MKTIPTYLILSFLCISFLTNAQLISSDPAFPTDADNVVITFDASLGSGGLAGYTGEVYAHTGVITSNSSSGSDWKYVVSNWGENLPETKLTNIGTDLYTLTISPSIRDYYGVPTGETILQMAFVFRSDVQVGGSYLEGKTAAGGDIFVDVHTSGLNVDITVPENYGTIAELNDIIDITAVSAESDSIAILIDNNWVISTSTNSLNYQITASDYGKHHVKAIAYSGSQQIIDSIYYYVRQQPIIEDLATGIEDGINYIDNQTVVLCLYAPGKDFVFAIGDFSNWEVSDSVYMKNTSDGNRWWVQLNNLVPQQEYIYQYLVDGELRVGDPYAEKTSDPWNDQYISATTYPDMLSYPAGLTNDVATVLQTGQQAYNWQNTSFQTPEKTDLVIYELLLRDFSTERSFQSIIDTLGYLKTLGINAIELMPVNEFEGNLSWGYNPSYYFAVDKYYGTKQKLQELIDICHGEGIAIIIDMVLNHSFGQSPLVRLYWDAANNQPSANSPYYNQVAMHDFNVGYDFNHESQATKEFSKRVMKFWLEEFKVDGFRFDLSKGFTQNNTLGNTSAWGQYDASRISIWKDYADYMWGIKSDAVVILEHFADNSEETELANYGMMLWGNANYAYNEATMGWNNTSNLDWAAYTTRGWNNPHLVSYMESHDEERLMAKNLAFGNANDNYDIQTLATALERCELGANFFFSIPGAKMIWQFGELGYDYHINYPGEIGDDDHRLDEKPVKWEYFSNTNRNKLFSVYRALIDLKKNEPAFKSTDFDLSVGNYAMKRIRITHSDMNVIVLGNFGVDQGSIDPQFHNTGWWYEFWTGDSVNISNINDNISLEAGEYRIYTDKKLYVPELSTEVLDVDNTSENLLSVFPNPAEDDINLFVKSIKNCKSQIEVYNISSKLVYSKNLKLNSGTNIISLEASEVSEPGLYIIKVQIGNEFLTDKFIRK